MTINLMLVDKDQFACQAQAVFIWQLATMPHELTSCAVCIDLRQALYVVNMAALPVTLQPTINAQLPDNIEWIGYRQLIATLAIDTANQLAKALQLVRWHADHRFCSRCGMPANFTTTIMMPPTICQNCHYHQYPRIQPCVITAIVKSIQGKPHLLLANHHRYKGQPMYGLIAGFVEVGESLEQCVYREVLEEVGITIGHPHYISSQPWPYPSNLMVGFIADYQAGDICIDTEELIHADFFALDNLPKIPASGTIARALIDQVVAHFN